VPLHVGDKHLRIASQSGRAWTTPQGGAVASKGAITRIEREMKRGALSEARDPSDRGDGPGALSRSPGGSVLFRLLAVLLTVTTQNDQEEDSAEEERRQDHQEAEGLNRTSNVNLRSATQPPSFPEHRSGCGDQERDTNSSI
jgi:hypothetical protein